jgi:thiol-disulfide isomerase/thioredoxin
MKTRKIAIFSILVLALGLGACAPAKSDTAMMDKPTEAVMAEPSETMMADATATMMVDPTGDMMDKPTEVMMNTPGSDAMMDATATPEEMMGSTQTPDAMMETPAWLGMSLTDVTSGETFTINEFKDKVVIVELMAQWCPTCKTQQMGLKSYLEKSGMPADLILIGLDIDPNENGAALKTYASDNGFHWMFAVSPVDVSHEIGNLYGNLFLNPPSAPVLVVDRKGVVHPLPLGIKSADDIMKAIHPYLNGM